MVYLHDGDGRVVQLGNLGLGLTLDLTEASQVDRDVERAALGLVFERDEVLFFEDLPALRDELGLDFLFVGGLAVSVLVDDSLQLICLNRRVVLRREVEGFPVVEALRLDEGVAEQVVEVRLALRRADEQRTTTTVHEGRADNLLPGPLGHVRVLVENDEADLHTAS